MDELRASRGTGNSISRHHHDVLVPNLILRILSTNLSGTLSFNLSLSPHPRTRLILHRYCQRLSTPLNSPLPREEGAVHF